MKPGATAAPRSVRRVLVASTIGTAIEWYDFYLYATASALVFGPLFFPGSSAAGGVLASFATYAAGFVARPLGGLVFGHFGDRVGRKSMMVWTLLVMGIATFGVGLLPTYDTAGVLAPVLLVTLRVAQGIGIGGEWGSAVLLSTEHGPPRRRGFLSSWPAMGFALALFGSNLTFVLISGLPEEDFLTWGWRLPFLASVVLVGIGIWVRLGIEETPEFVRGRAAAPTARVPVITVLRRWPRRVLIGVLASLGTGSVIAMFTVFLVAHAAKAGPEVRSTVLTGLMIAALGECVTLPVFGALSDRFGRRPVMIFGYVVAVAAMVPAGAWLSSGDPTLAVLVFVPALTIAHGAIYGGLAAFLVDLFPTMVRFSAIAVTYQVGVTISSFLPLVAVAITADDSSLLPVVALFAAVQTAAAVAVACAPDSRADAELLADPAGERRPVGRAVHGEVGNNR
ncbi:MFS transporter [Streptomyces griseus]|uniref:MFS transporter n=1 Tax=Streptomyces griseus TaxID=1911 RepID=UPI0004CAA244|nr:MFS transporter [Streptomyces griseus]